MIVQPDPTPADLLAAIGAARDHVRELVAVLTGANNPRVAAHVSADVLAHVNHLARDQHGTRDPVAAHARDLVRDLTYARDLAAALAPGRLGAGTGPGAPAGTYALTCALADHLELARTLAGDPEMAQVLARRLNRDHAHLRRLIGDLRSADAAATSRAAGRATPPGPVCRRLVAGAVRMLPAAHRARYAGEWAADLWMLGGLPRSKRQQLGYAFGLVATCWSLRRALTAPDLRVSTGDRADPAPPGRG